MAKSLCNINPITYLPSRHNRSRPLVLSRRVTRVTMSRNNHHQPFWGSIEEQIEAHLRKVVAVREPVSVFEPMHRLIFAAPRNAAPALCVAACELVGGRRDQAMAAAAALHVLHAASFTHEQLPLSDRRGLMPMTHHAFGPDIELLIGDGMIPFGFELVAKSDDPDQNNSDRILRVIVEMTRAIGSQGVVGGQYSELRHSQLDGTGPWHVELIDDACEKKEGGLHACGAACGAILGGGSEEEIERLRNYGLYVGLIRGTLRRRTRQNRSRRVEELRNLALEELIGFDEAKVEEISSIVEASLSHI